MSAKTRPRAFMLVLVILMLILLLTAGMAFVGKRALQYRGTTQAVSAAVARELAESGLEDARVKLQKNLLFPPFSAADQSSFTYTERLLAQDGTTLIGSYTVTVDLRYATLPYSILVVTSVGQVASSTCMRQLRAELDIATVDRATGLPPNAKLFLYRNFQDEGSF